MHGMSRMAEDAFCSQGPMGSGRPLKGAEDSLHRPPRGRHNVAQGQRHGAAVERHPGSRKTTSINPVGVAQSCACVEPFQAVL